MNNEYSSKISPLFKYIGGKSWLRDELRKKVSFVLKNNSHITNYAEPFSGGLGSFLNVYDVLLEHHIQNVMLSDINPILMKTYQLINTDPQIFIKTFLNFEKKFEEYVDVTWKNKKSKEEIKKALKPAELYFNQIKKDFNVNKSTISVEQSARLVFLQKHAFNGVYRENAKGEYNTPFNWSGNTMLETFEQKVMAIHQVFRQFNLICVAQSFDHIVYNEDTLYYLDPPYLNETMGENKYNKDAFSLEQQLELIHKIEKSSFIYSNHKSNILLTEFLKMKNVQTTEVIRKNIMSANVKSRQKNKTEILVVHQYT